ncbi:MAG TPA: glycosyltransferase family 39 protein [Gaiellaceae bacterium]|nr:glycosyltransferase family 39 protein [Gaiellaceae bacterium]
MILRANATTAGAVAVAIGATIVRFPRVVTDPFWQDEVASARILREPSVGSMLGRVARTESTPPLWYALGWLLHQLGVSLTDVRIVSVLAGALLAALVVRFAADVVPVPAAILAGVLVSLGGQFAFADRELRAYALLALLSVVFAFVLERGAVLPLAIVTTLGALTHYFFLFTVAAGLAWLWLEPEARARRRRATVAIAAGLALVAPWLPYALRQYEQDRYSWIGAFNGREVVNTALRLFTPLGHTEWLPLAFLGLVVAGAVRLARMSARGRLCAALAFGPIVLAGAAWLGGVQIYADRNLIEAGAFVAVCGVAALPVRRLSLVAAPAAAALMVFSFVVAQTPATPYAQIARALVGEGWRAGDPVAVFGSPYDFRSPLEWYLPHGPQLAIYSMEPRCGATFVVAGRAARRSLRDDLRSGRRAGPFLVARTDPDKTLRDERWLSSSKACYVGVRDGRA